MLEKSIKKTKTDLKSLGYIKNLSTFVSELQNLLIETPSKAEQSVLEKNLDKQFNDGSIRYLNKFGYENDKTETKLVFENAHYILFQTGYKNASKDEILCWFYRHRVDLKYTGIFFGTQKDFKENVKDETSFKMGYLSFDNWKDGFSFLEDLADNTIPEKWIYHHHKAGIPHPILKSYIENIFEKLKKESNKILKSDDNKYIIFNSNLLDKYFHDIFIVCEVVIDGDEESYRNPFRLKSFSDLIKLRFTVNSKQVKDQHQLPEKPTFFKDINEVIFQTNWSIDRSFEKFEHIIEERKDRFPSTYQSKKNDELARALDNAINYAIAIAQRNYKFIVPQYRPQEDKIQLLMPIYLSGSFTEKPDFALILDPDTTNQIYLPQTILPLDMAYQNARLIAKPDEYWLNPDNI